MIAAPASARVAITGAGLVCALGTDKAKVWSAVSRGETGIGPMAAMEQAPLPGRYAGEVRFAGARDDELDPREVRLLRQALREALGEAGIASGWPCADHRVGIIVGTTLGGM